MTYKIRTNDMTLFDIEYYVKSDDAKEPDKSCYLELRSCTCVKNLLKYTRENISDEQFQQFAQDCDDIDELRGWLFETHNNNELLAKTYDEIKKNQYVKIQKELEEILKEFCERYNFIVVTD